LRAEELAIQKKLELRDELTGKNLASKADLQILRAEIQAMEAKIEKEILRFDRKFTISVYHGLFFTLLVNQLPLVHSLLLMLSGMS